jgi:hypothetical protein
MPEKAFTDPMPPPDHAPRRSFIHAMVETVINAAGDRGLTCDEVEMQTGLPHTEASVTINELSSAGVLLPRGKRMTRAGRHATVWSRDTEK